MNIDKLNGVFKFEPSYELITHKNVYNANVMLAIPEGDKCFTWFVKHNGINICLLLDSFDSHSKPLNSVPLFSHFKDDLLGTILYGTYFLYNNTPCFCIEDIYYSGCNFIQNKPFLFKLQILNQILQQVQQQQQQQVQQQVQQPIFGLPLMETDFNAMLKNIPLLPYKISQIKFRFFDNPRKIVTMTYYKPNTNLDYNLKPKQKNQGYNQGINNQKRTKVFKITADFEPDIYNLFSIDEEKEEYYGIALIPSYKTSVMMNCLFRNIKENGNLDSMEESDDEEEFQNEKEDKYVYLDKSFNMLCEYNYKFKKWCPLSVV